MKPRIAEEILRKKVADSSRREQLLFETQLGIWRKAAAIFSRSTFGTEYAELHICPVKTKNQYNADFPEVGMIVYVDGDRDALFFGLDAGISIGIEFTPEEIAWIEEITRNDEPTGAGFDEFQLK